MNKYRREVSDISTYHIKLHKLMCLWITHAVILLHQNLEAFIVIVNNTIAIGILTNDGTSKSISIQSLFIYITNETPRTCAIDIMRKFLCRFFSHRANNIISFKVVKASRHKATRTNKHKEATIPFHLFLIVLSVCLLMKLYCLYFQGHTCHK